MRILFDYQAFEYQNFGGVSRSFVKLCEHLTDNINPIIGVKESDNVYLKDSRFSNNINPLHYRHDKVFGKRQFFKGQWRITQAILSSLGYHSDLLDVNKLYCIDLLKERQFDIFHPTFFDPYFLPFLGDKPFVLTIHDMIPERYPQYFPRDNAQIIAKKLLAPLASAIITVSEKTKEDVIQVLNIPEDKIHVIYHGPSFHIYKNPQKLFNFKYILYVGDRSKYKNFILFVNNISPFLSLHPEINVVCTGLPFTDEEKDLFDCLGIKDRFIQTMVKSDNTMYNIYHFAECFVYPSEYEGFGIPILEAYSSDCPVLLCESSCFPEIAGDAAFYFNADGSDLAVQLDRIITQTPTERQEILSKQRRRLSFYSWQNSAKQLSDVYSSIV